jgi:hypothetical protein
LRGPFPATSARRGAFQAPVAPRSHPPSERF